MKLYSNIAFGWLLYAKSILAVDLDAICKSTSPTSFITTAYSSDCYAVAGITAEMKATGITCTLGTVNAWQQHHYQQCTQQQSYGGYGGFGYSSGLGLACNPPGYNCKCDASETSVACGRTPAVDTQVDDGEEPTFPAGPKENCYELGKIPVERRDVDILCWHENDENCKCKTKPETPEILTQIDETAPDEVDFECSSAAEAREIAGIPDWRKDIKCKFGYKNYEPKCSCWKDPSGPTITDQIDNGESPITWPSPGPDDNACREQAQVGDREDIVCTYDSTLQQCSCEKLPSVVDACKRGECPVTFSGGPEDSNCRRAGGVPDDRLDIQCKALDGGKCTCWEIPDVVKACNNGNCPVTFPGGPTDIDCRRAAQIPDDRTDIICKSTGDGNCNCYSIPNVVGVCDKGNCPVTWPAEGPIDCRRGPQIPDERKDISCTFDSATKECTCACSTCGPTDPVDIKDVDEECDAGRCPVTFPGGPLPKNCRRQTGIPLTRKDIVCTVNDGICSCNREEVDNGGTDNGTDDGDDDEEEEGLDPDTIDEDGTEFEGGPTDADCRRKSQLAADRDDIECFFQADRNRCRCRKIRPGRPVKNATRNRCANAAKTSRCTFIRNCFWVKKQLLVDHCSDICDGALANYEAEVNPKCKAIFRYTKKANGYELCTGKNNFRKRLVCKNFN